MAETATSRPLQLYGWLYIWSEEDGVGTRTFRSADRPAPDPNDRCIFNLVPVYAEEGAPATLSFSECHEAQTEASHGE